MKMYIATQMVSKVRTAWVFDYIDCLKKLDIFLLQEIISRAFCWNYESILRISMYFSICIFDFCQPRTRFAPGCRCFSSHLRRFPIQLGDPCIKLQRFLLNYKQQKIILCKLHHPSGECDEREFVQYPIWKHYNL